MARRSTDPYAGYRFLLQLGALPAAGFAECTGLQAETKVLDYVEGGRNGTTLKFPEATGYSNVVLKRGVGFSNELLYWQLDAAYGLFVLNPRLISSAAIVLQDERGRPVRFWLLIRAFPVKWTGPDLKAGANEVAIETLELAHEGIVPL